MLKELKKYVVLITLILICYCVQSQNYYVKTDTMSHNTNDSYLAYLSYNYIYNTTSDTLYLTWVRTKSDLTSGWHSSICDEIICHDTDIVTSTFTIDPFDSTYLVGHFIFNKIQGNGVIELAVFDQTDSLNSNILLTYILNVYPYTGIIQEKIDPVKKIYPNPTKGNLLVDLGENKENVTMTLVDIRGELIETWSFENVNRIQLNIEAPVGLYILKIDSGIEHTTFRVIRE